MFWLRDACIIFRMLACFRLLFFGIYIFYLKGGLSVGAVLYCVLYSAWWLLLLIPPSSSSSLNPSKAFLPLLYHEPRQLLGGEGIYC